MSPDSPDSGITAEFRHAHGWTYLLNAMGSVYWFTALFSHAPLTSVVLFVSFLLFVLAVLLPSGATWSLFLLVAGSAALLLFLELSHRKAQLTRDSLLLHWGAFRRRTRSYPLSEVRSVDVRYPLLGRSLDVGDVEIQGYGWATSLVAVRHPSRCAELISAGQKAVTTG
jgi:uncharacterized membrane protein YdbT with pleckstrin-like domain